MATMNAAEVTLGSALATGAIYVAPKGSTLPTDATTTLDAAFTLLGFTSDAGVQLNESRSTNGINAWEGRTQVYNTVTEYYEQLVFTPIQCNADVLAATWGDDNVAVGNDGTITAKHSGANIEPVCIVIEMVPRDGFVRRLCGTYQLTERGGATYDGTQVDGRQLTFNSIADEDGVTTYEYVAVTEDEDEDEDED